MVKLGRTAKRRVIGLGAAVVCALTLAPAALGADDLHDEGMETWWDGNTLNVPWNGFDEYETIAGDKFHHDAVAVPGDWIYRSLAVRNNGPCPGQLTVEILNPNSIEEPDTVNDDDPGVALGRVGFAGMSELHWDVGGTKGSSSFADLTHQQRLATVGLPRGGVTNVKVGYKFPYDETGGKHLGFPSQQLTWDLGLRLSGLCDWGEMSGPALPSTTPPPTTSQDPSPSASSGSPSTTGPTSATTPAPSPSDGAGGKLPWTGANITFAIVSATFLIAAGITALRSASWRRQTAPRA
ncbi:MAG: hypothetical protein LBO20_08385 [Bifidobacteriaceae bacterium]|jgi:hypothetical protein|nr:hypothetical protein [Bifidobacteriaceae bacterium]